MLTLGQSVRFALQLALCLGPRVAHAEADRPSESRPAARINEAAPLRHALGINPIFAPLGTVTGEYEVRLFSPATSLGLSAWYEYKDVRARWVYVKALVYPWGVALRGLGVGLTVGALRAYREPEQLTQMATDSAATLGIIAQYNFVFGPNDLLLVGLGLGGRTPLKSIPDNSPLSRVDGDGRIIAGVAF